MTSRILEEAPGVYPVTAAQAELLARHLSIVLERNRQLNLTRITDTDEAIRKHVLDSLAVAPLLSSCPEGKLVDLGSGAGYPGIPLAVVSGRPTTLVESIAKKALLLRDLVSDLGLDIEVLDKRAEEVALDRPRAYSVVVARALTSLPSLLELAAPLLAGNGCLLAMKGRLDADERSGGERVAEIVGMRHARTIPLEVPGVDERHVVVYEVVGRPRRRLPRRPGQAQRRPLA